MKKNGILSRLFGGNSAASPAPVGAMLGAIVNRPMLMAPRALDAMIASAMSMPAREAYREEGDYSWPGSKPEHLLTIEGDIGILMVEGPLFLRWGTEAWWWGGNGYDMIVAAHRMLVADPKVKQIVHVYDSGGGQCAGCFDAVDAIKATRGQKPITAVVSDDAYSAAYALASAADKIIVSRTGGVGSIGVRATHVDVTGWDAAVGLKYTIIVDGDKKADGDMHLPLSDSAHAELQAEVSRIAVIFRETVAANRGIDVAAVEAQQAGCFYAEGAISAGLADAIGTLESTVAAITAPASESDNAPAPAEDEPTDPEAASTAAATAEADVALAAASAAVRQLAMTLPGDGSGDAPPAAAEQHADLGNSGEARAASFASAVAASALPSDLGIALIARGHADQAPAEAIAYASALRDLAFAAGDERLAVDFVKSNTPIETARSQLIALKATDGPEIVTTLKHKTGEAAASNAEKLDSTQIYEDRRRAAAAGTGIFPRQ